MNEYLLMFNAIACGATAFRLLAFRRHKATHRPIAAFFAYLLIVACGSVTIRTLIGDYQQANWSETLINIGFCVSVWSARGNVMRLAKPLERKKL